jgi:uncharacterized protein
MITIQLLSRHYIRIDKDAIWYFRGDEMKRPDIVQYLYHYLKRDSAGQYVIEIENDRCYVMVEDAPYVIKSIDLGFSHDHRQPCILLSLSDGSTEELNLDNTFWAGEDNVLYCRVKRGEYTARFSRSAYYQLCAYIEYDSTGGKYLITLNDRSYPMILTDKP